MKNRLWFAAKIAHIARWLPARMRGQFGVEMEDVLSEHLQAAAARGWGPLLGAALRELLHLPGLYARERVFHNHSFGGGTIMSKPFIFDDRKEPTPWGWALVGSWPFLFGLFGWLVWQIFAPVFMPTNQDPLPLPGISSAYLLLTVGICAVLIAAWVRGFPVWSYTLGTFFLLFSVYLTNVALPGFSLPGYTFGRQSLGLVALIPLAAVISISLLLTRKDVARPFAEGLRDLRADFTRVSFGLFGLTPFFLWIMFDEMHGEEPFLLATSLFLGGCALVYLRARRVALGMGAMLAGLLLAYSASAVYLWWYWEGRLMPGMATPIDGLSNMIGTMTCALPIIFLTLGPWLVYRLNQRVGSENR
jgi:hypothetical protein